MNFWSIDFGTSNTVITRWNHAKAQAEAIAIPGISLQLLDNPPLIPSLVYVQNAQQNKVIIGQAVRDSGLDITKDNRYFSSFKRGIGAKIQGFQPELDNTTVTLEQVGEWFLQNLLQNTPEPPDSLVLTVPVDSFESYRHWLSSVCESWGIGEIRLIDEPTAAALGYGITGEKPVLVVDFGGGTLDLSLVQLAATTTKNAGGGFLLKWQQKTLSNDSTKVKTARVIAKAGKNLGGADIDNWLVDYFVDSQAIPRLPLITRLAEKLKITLSTQEEASEAYFDDENFETYELNLTRQQLEEILQQQGFFQQLNNLMQQVLQQAQGNNISEEDISAVLLVGGSGQIPAVKQWLRGYFSEDKIKCSRPFDAIATGALQITQGVKLQDYLYHSYGIRYWNRKEQRHSWHPLIKAGQAYPMTTPVELILGASVENQPSIELIIGELGADRGATEVYFDGNRLVTRNLKDNDISVQPLNDREGARTLASLEPAGYPGIDRIKLEFKVDEQRYLRLSVEDLLTHQTLLDNKIVVKLS